MVVFGQGGCIRTKWLYSIVIGKVIVVFGQSVFIGAKVAKSRFVFGQGGCIRAKVVVFGQSSGKSGCIAAKLLYSAKSVCNGQKWLCSGKVGLFGQ